MKGVLPMIFQVGAALLDACVLATLRHEDAYGYVLTQTLMGTLEISESTLYPVLRRLQKGEFLSTYDRPWQGRNRRYYSITKKGLAQAEIYRSGWQEYKRRVDSLIDGDGANIKTEAGTDIGAAVHGTEDLDMGGVGRGANNKTNDGKERKQ
jgi:PadR family transcriptional regulator PadR